MTGPQTGSLSLSSFLRTWRRRDIFGSIRAERQFNCQSLSYELKVSGGRGEGGGGKSEKEALEFFWKPMKLFLLLLPLSTTTRPPCTGHPWLLLAIITFSVGSVRFCCCTVVLQNSPRGSEPSMAPFVEKMLP